MPITCGGCGRCSYCIAEQVVSTSSGGEDE
jgi:hypothetical protein